MAKIKIYDGSQWVELAKKTDIPTSLPASDVYAWAKASTKPSYTASEVGALKNYGTDVSRPNGTNFTFSTGTNAVQMRSGATSGTDIGIFYLSDDNSFVVNSGDSGFNFAVFDCDKGADFSSVDNAAFAILQSWGGVKMKGDLTVEGSISEGGTALSSKYLGINAKAADSDKLDGNDSSYFINTSNIGSQYVAYASLAGGVAWANVTGKPSFATVATSGSYNDLSNKPTIPTETTVSGWGFTKNAGTVTGIKIGTGDTLSPSSGIVTIPAYPTTLPASDVYAWAKASTKPDYTASEVGALPSSTKYGKSLAVSGTSVSLKDQDGTVLSTITTQDTTYESLSASSGSSSVSLCTRGEKYTWNNKQAALVSGSNIKTINGQSILGSGNISISGAGYSTALYSHTVNFQINLGGSYFGAASITYICNVDTVFLDLESVAYYMYYNGPDYDDDLPYVGLIPASGFVYNVSHKYTVYGACYKYRNGNHYIRLAAVTESGAVEYLDVNDGTLMGNSVVTDYVIRIN